MPENSQIHTISLDLPLDSDSHGNGGVSALEEQAAKAKDSERPSASAEKERYTAEKARHDAEKARHDAEKARHDAEKSRYDAEKSRHDSNTAKSGHWRAWISTGAGMVSVAVSVIGLIIKNKKS